MTDWNNRFAVSDALSGGDDDRRLELLEEIEEREECEYTYQDQ